MYTHTHNSSDELWVGSIQFTNPFQYPQPCCASAGSKWISDLAIKNVPTRPFRPSICVQHCIGRTSVNMHAVNFTTLFSQHFTPVVVLLVIVSLKFDLRTGLLMNIVYHINLTLNADTLTYHCFSFPRRVQPKNWGGETIMKCVIMCYIYVLRWRSVLLILLCNVWLIMKGLPFAELPCMQNLRSPPRGTNNAFG